MTLADVSCDLNAALEDSLLDNDLLEDLLSCSNNLFVLEIFSANSDSVGQRFNLLENIWVWLVFDQSSILLNSGLLLVNIGHSTSDYSVSENSSSENLGFLWSDGN